MVQHSPISSPLQVFYAAAGLWDQVSLVRTMMQERGFRKEPGVSWIEIDNKIHRFVVGDTSHPERKKFCCVNLTKELKAEACHIPDTRPAFRNTDEDKEFASPCSHSKELAIAYGRMHAPHGKPIRVRKNLRV